LSRARTVVVPSQKSGPDRWCGTRIERERTHPRAISRAVQRAAKRAEITGNHSAYSLRA